MFYLPCIQLEGGVVLDRREFLQLGGIGMGVLTVPIMGQSVPLFGATGPIPTADRNEACLR